MLQIAHDVAPGSKLCFATANGGQLNFANNIRNLADKSGPCGADVVVDDITYPDEPMFSDGVISDAIDEVAAQRRELLQLRRATRASRTPGSRRCGWSRGIGGRHEPEPRRRRPGAVRRWVPGREPRPRHRRRADHQDRCGRRHASTSSGTTRSTRTAPTSGTRSSTTPGSSPRPPRRPRFTFTPTPDQVGTTALFKVDGIPSGSTDVILTVTKPDGTDARSPGHRHLAGVARHHARPGR